MIFLPTYEPGVKENSSYFFTFPDKKTAENLFYVGQTTHYYVDAKYYFSHNILEELHYLDGVSLNRDGRFYSKKHAMAFDMRFLACYLVSGTMMFIGNEIYTAGSGQVILFDKTKAHSYCALGNVELFTIIFDGNCSKMLVDELIQDSNIFPTQSMVNVHNIFRDIQEVAENGIEIPPIIQSAHVHNLLSLLYQSRYTKPEEKKSRIADCVDYINTHYHTALSTDTLAQIACLSHSQFSNLFKKELGVTPHEYLLQVRFAVAKNHLSTANMSIAEIAYDVGFNSDVHFMSLFKKRFGMTPSDFRKAHRDSELNL